MTNKIKIGVLLASLALVATGCWQKAIYPFYKEADLIADARLLGVWKDPKNENDKTTWTFTQDGDKAYRLTIVEETDRHEFDARRFKLGDTELLDLYSRKRAVSELPAHNLMKVEFDEGSLKLSSMSIGWVRGWLAAHKTEIAHIQVNDPVEPANQDKMECVLTAPTEELQKFVRAHKDVAGFFDDPAVFQRQH